MLKPSWNIGDGEILKRNSRRPIAQKDAPWAARIIEGLYELVGQYGEIILLKYGTQSLSQIRSSRCIHIVLTGFEDKLHQLATVNHFTLKAFHKVPEATLISRYSF